MRSYFWGYYAEAVLVGVDKIPRGDEGFQFLNLFSAQRRWYLFPPQRGGLFAGLVLVALFLKNLAAGKVVNPG